MCGRHGDVDGRPGDAVAGAAGHARDLVSLEVVHERRLAVNRRRHVPLLPVVVVPPRVHLNDKESRKITVHLNNKESRIITVHLNNKEISKIMNHLCF